MSPATRSTRVSMRVLLGLAAMCLTLSPSLGFLAPGRFSVASGQHVVSKGATTPARTSCRMAAEEEKEQKKGKTKPPTWMFNREGIAYAPWMVDAFDPENLEKVAKSIEERKKREAEAVPEALGALARDPQQMELSGTGVTAKRVMGSSVELTWGTGDETNNVGFIISRRKAKTDTWEEIASYQNFPSLNSRGPKGGRYTYLDEDVPEGTYVYRISDVNRAGSRSDLCQTLIELQSGADELQTKIGVAGLVLLLAAAVAAGTLSDPFQ